LPLCRFRDTLPINGTLMAQYAVGDIQGCFRALVQLIEGIRFDPAKDRLWFVGDLVNRGPDSLAVLRYIKDLGPSAVTVLGNHDLHLLAVAVGSDQLRPKDTFHNVLDARDRDEIVHWLRHRPLIYRDNGFLLLHAGLLPQWTATDALALASEVERALQGQEHQKFLSALCQFEPSQWSDSLDGAFRLVAITKVLTRLRVCTPDGKMDLSFKAAPDQVRDGFLPWFQVPGRRSNDVTIVCGHWAALGLHLADTVLALDSGCVYGRRLTAVRIDDRQIFQVSCGAPTRV
jgi:bis(5'-nucleosyl)-tetraphosphatase (symmetrical)